MTVAAEDLRKLLTSDLPDPTLVLVEGRVEVVKVDDLDTDALRGALLLTSRDELLARGVREDADDRQLQEHAAAISTVVDLQGG
ncbi:hypothetical protein [Saccharothrix coeruleofusca]|uniref:Uncharacterized protein n=1 Tax=Saccharothrix coeruleofusca TaxID=33919 RepID=A0A918EDB8_9PSEU|nr:hypothetical protein [Saccharothrix coeruleofusca]MBP2334168.1 hypothetical protein [Saccharothrix coeruleofusca]GGP42983.1 hypothetical protein GCM10010185_13130 [Saccharothrix coeruleofusca]